MDVNNHFHQYSEETLASVVSSGELDAFNQLVWTYQNMAYSHAYALLGVLACEVMRSKAPAPEMGAGVVAAPVAVASTSNKLRVRSSRHS